MTWTLPLVLICSLASPGCVSANQGEFFLRASGAVSGEFEGCAGAHFDGQMLRLFLTSSEPPLGQLEFGLTLARQPATEVTLVWLNMLSSTTPEWRQPGKGFGSVSFDPYVSYMAQSGWVRIEELADDRVVGRFSVYAPSPYAGLEGTDSPQARVDSFPVEPLTMVGQFSAPLIGRGDGLRPARPRCPRVKTLP